MGHLFYTNIIFEELMSIILFKIKIKGIKEEWKNIHMISQHCLYFHLQMLSFNKVIVKFHIFIQVLQQIWHLKIALLMHAENIVFLLVNKLQQFWIITITISFIRWVWQINQCQTIFAYFNEYYKIALQKYINIISYEDYMLQKININ